MNSILNVLTNRKPAQRPPVWLMRQAGRYLPEYRALRDKAGSFMDLALTPEYATEVTLQPVRRFQMDGAILFSDILMVPYGLGLDLTFAEGEGPRLSACDVAQLSMDRLLDRTAPVFEAVKQITADKPAPCTLLGFAGAPWTLACYMIEGRSRDGFPNAKRMAYEAPERLDALIDILVDATVLYVDAQIRAGAQVIQIFESWASLLDAPAFKRFAIEPTARIVAALKQKHPNVPIIGFPRDVADSMMLAYANGTGIDGMSIGATTDIVEFSKMMPMRLALQGNMDPTRLLIGGQQMRDEARRIVDGMADAPFIFNLGHGVIKETPPEHVAELVAVVRGDAS